MCMCSLTEEVEDLMDSAEGWREGLHMEFKASREKLSSDLWSSFYRGCIRRIYREICRI